MNTTKLLETNDSWLLTAQRGALALVMFPHGAQKLFGWFGGYGFRGTMGFLTGGAHLPSPVAFLVIAIESFGALALSMGALTRVAALGIVAVMLGAILTVHLPSGFFMNWSGAQAGEGIEYHLLAIALALPLIVRGGGRWSVDGFIAKARGGLNEAIAR